MLLVTVSQTGFLPSYVFLILNEFLLTVELDVGNYVSGIKVLVFFFLRFIISDMTFQPRHCRSPPDLLPTIIHYIRIVWRFCRKSSETGVLKVYFLFSFYLQQETFTHLIIFSFFFYSLYTASTAHGLEIQS